MNFESRGGGRIYAALLVLIALLARELHAPQAPVRPTTDVESAWRMHRVSLAISSPRLAQVDRALSFPTQRSVTQLPLHDELCALAARFGLGLSRGDVGELPAPRRLERFLRGMAPLLAALTLLLIYRWLREEGRFSVRASLAGLGMVAFLPGFFELGIPGRVSVEALAGLGLLPCIAWLVQTWRKRDALDRMTYAMFAGAGVGIGLATSPLFLVLHIVALLMFCRGLLVTSGEARQVSARVALLYWITSALLAQLPTLGGPWIPATEGVIEAWTQLVQMISLVSLLPLVLGLAASKREVSRTAARAFVFVAVGSVCGCLYFSAAARALFGGMTHTPELGSVSWIAARCAAVLGLVVLIAWSRAPRARDELADRMLLWLGGSVCFAALFEPVFLIAALAPLAFAAGHIASSRVGLRLITGSACAFLMALLIPVFTRSHEPTKIDHVAAACAWLDENSPSISAWGAATAVQDWGIGVEPEFAPLVLWHARRPALGLGDRWARGAQLSWPQRELEAIQNLAQLRFFSQQAGVRYWILAPGSAQRMGCTPEMQAALEELRTGDSAATEGFSRIWTSPGGSSERVSVFGLARPQARN